MKLKLLLEQKYIIIDKKYERFLGSNCTSELAGTFSLITHPAPITLFSPITIPFNTMTSLATQQLSFIIIGTVLNPCVATALFLTLKR